MIIDNTMMTQKGGRLKEAIVRINPLSSRINFSAKAVELLKTDSQSQYLYFRFRVDGKALYIIPGKVPTAIVAKIHPQRVSCCLADRNIVEALMKHIPAMEGGVKLKVEAAVAQRYEGYSQFPLI